MKKILMGLLAGLLLSAAVQAGDFEDGYAAYKKSDYATALKLWRPLAERSNAEAQCFLGVMYAIGQGMAQDYQEAVKWYRLAAAQGNTAAQGLLGLMYEMGLGVAQDYAHAHMWFNLAAAQGNESDRKLRDIVATKMTPAQIASAQELARECLKRQYKNCD